MRAVLCVFLVVLCAGRAAAALRVAGPEAGFAAMASGPAAAAWNPATLALYPETRLELLALQCTVSNSSYSLSDYNRFNGAYWTEDDKRALLASIESSQLTVDGGARVGALGFATGGFAFTTETRAMSGMAVPKAAFEILLFGNTPGETFDLTGADGEGIAFTEFRISYARDLSRFFHSLPPRLEGWTVGASAKLLHGWAYAELLEASGGITTTDELIYADGKLRSVLAQGGSGYGFDLGFAGPLGGNWTGSLAARDLFASLTWTGDCEERIDTFGVAGLTLGDVDDDLVETASATRSLDEVTTALPAVFSIGAAHHGRRFLTAFLVETATSSAFGASGKPRASLATAWQALGWLVLRGSTAIGGTAGPSIGGSLGLGLGPFQLDLGSRTLGSLNPFDGKGIGLVAGLAIGL